LFRISWIEFSIKTQKGYFMIKKTLLVALIATTIFADCTYTSNTAKVTWKAFKTYEKIGVGGSFDRVIVQPKSAITLEALLVGSSAKIDTASVNSGNVGRDATLVASFFKTQNIDTITAKIISLKDSKAITQISMNNITKTIPLAYTAQEGVIIAKGTIDLGDFTMLPSLASINKACFDLHGGKTWQDVEIGFEIPIKSDCK
jgi:polyisoprenoid-binding protein YceI